MPLRRPAPAPQDRFGYGVVLSPRPVVGSLLGGTPLGHRRDFTWGVCECGVACSMLASRLQAAGSAGRPPLCPLCCVPQQVLKRRVVLRSRAAAAWLWYPLGPLRR